MSRKNTSVICEKCKQVWKGYPVTNYDGINSLCEKCYKEWNELYLLWINGRVIIKK